MSSQYPHTTFSSQREEYQGLSPSYKTCHVWPGLPGEVRIEKIDRKQQNEELQQLVVGGQRTSPRQRRPKYKPAETDQLKPSPRGGIQLSSEYELKVGAAGAPEGV